MAYINVYELTREYSGPEEGGTFHTNCEVISSVRVRGGINSPKARTAFNAEVIAQGLTKPGLPLRWNEKAWPGMRECGQVDKIRVTIESTPAKAWNNWQHYS